jgi:hypothetical protein
MFIVCKIQLSVCVEPIIPPTKNNLAHVSRHNLQVQLHLYQHGCGQCREPWHKPRHEAQHKMQEAKADVPPRLARPTLRKASLDDGVSEL